ncbi:hypothetical protein QFC21_000075 [Naganishia friedmannii]|uniref:Uncharacterized protein n=1 Tax=Naganishia friedmannii TaxID=89922 RepID=A0ACC2WBN4_9TREE|nr:hypothetical protein QFC21_000075 [Naganishia friedmannii]
MASRSAENMWQSASAALRSSTLSNLNASSSRIPTPSRSFARLASTAASATTPSLQPLLPASTPALPALPTTTSDAVSLIQSSSTPQLGRYVLARLHSRNYLLHPRDILTVPHLKGSPPPGTILALNRILQVGSRDFVIKAPEPDAAAATAQKSPFGAQGDREVIPQQVVQCHVTVMEHTKSPMERKLLKKRRKGYKKTIENKQGWTRLRVGDVFVGSEANHYQPTDSHMKSSLQMEYLQGLLRLALHQSQSVDQQQQPADAGWSAKPDLPNRSGSVQHTSKAVSPPPPLAVNTDTGMNVNEERVVSRFETILDNKLKDFEERIIKPLALGIRHIKNHCTQIEARMLLEPELAKQPLNGTTLSPLRPNMPGSYRPSPSAGSSAASFSERPAMESKNQPCSKTMQMVSDLLAQIGKDGLSSEISTIILGNKVSSTTSTSPAVDRKEQQQQQQLGVADDDASNWSDSVFGDWREVKPARSNSAKPITHSNNNNNNNNNKAEKYVMPEERKVGETLVLVEPTGIAVRLNSEHIKYLKRLVEGLPCAAIKNGKDCEDGEDCIYAHKCAYGWNCKYGESCRFFDIPGAHPDSGEFHRKKNYYDGSTKDAPADGTEASSSGW